MEALHTFLARHPPFDELGAAELERLSAEARVVQLDEGATALIEDGPPSEGLWVLLTGSMDLLHEGESVQVLEPGESFGHPSLLTGLAPAFTVRARERASCAMFPRDVAARVLATPGGVRYVAHSMRGRMTNTGHTVHALLDVGTTPVAAVMRPAVFCPGDTPVREAARLLGEAARPALLVELGRGRLGLVSDAEIRRAVAADPPALDAPVATIARTPLTTVPAAQLAVEATVDMLAAGAEHVAVVDGERVCGVITAGDLIGLEARSPIALRHTLLAATDEAELQRAAVHLPRLFLLLHRAGVPSTDIGRVLSLQQDTVVSRLLDFSMARHGPAPAAWVWLDLGSAARRELTLASDQDNALAYADATPAAEARAEAYFAQVAADVNAGLTRCGIGIDSSGVLAGQARWRMPKAGWLRTFRECLLEPDESQLLKSTVAFDFRPTAGGLELTAELTERIREARGHPAFMKLLARSTCGVPIALGFRGQLATEKQGEASGRLDIKRSGIIPLVNLVRFHALANGVTISPTLDRIEAVESVGGLPHGHADALREAFTVMMRIRLEHHAAAIDAGLPPDNLIDPGELTPIARTELREALLVLKRAQRQLAGWAPAAA
ncbi:MAG TPA: putative nucleotidyltransferase substrate binding domain-containing protein [Solirubrobacteraceae bacterium]|nr:putative nucleotidyltransferase substrate binding domain-containing protein [Solirubrobacteraceae bacterium]